METQPKTFPYRALLNGGLRGNAMHQIAAVAGPPTCVEGPVWQWVAQRDVPAGMLGDPASTTVTIWATDGVADHAHLHLRFSAGLHYDEVLW